MLHFDDIVFGPIFSRRLGSSLGVNILPSKGKLCNFDCVYCECGWNKDGIAERRFPTLAEVEEALEAKMSKAVKEGVPVDSITFSGNGEPTIHPKFAAIIDDTLALRDKYFPKAKVSVLTNATLVTRPAVFEALSRVDNNILKLDTVCEEYIRFVDRPTMTYNLDEIIEKLKMFGKNAVIQTMFMKGKVDGRSVDNTGDEYVLPWLETVKKIAPREVMIYTVDRETPQQGLQKATREELDRIVDLLRNEGISATASY